MLIATNIRKAPISATHTLMTMFTEDTTAMSCHVTNVKNVGEPSVEAMFLRCVLDVGEPYGIQIPSTHANAGV